VRRLFSRVMRSRNRFRDQKKGDYVMADDPKTMPISAELRIVELSDSDIETMKTMYAVRRGETVEDLLRRVGMTGTSIWHYSQAELRIKLVKE
jgi:hypothetical protein